jgi:hypothetical protein
LARLPKKKKEKGKKTDWMLIGTGSYRLKVKASFVHGSYGNTKFSQAIELPIRLQSSVGLGTRMK